MAATATNTRLLIALMIVGVVALAAIGAFAWSVWSCRRRRFQAYGDDHDDYRRQVALDCGADDEPDVTALAASKGDWYMWLRNNCQQPSSPSRPVLVVNS